MKWQGRRRSANVEDRRGMRAGGLAAGGGVATLIILAIALFTGTDPGELTEIVGGPSASTQGPAPPPPEDDPQAAFVSVVLADTEETWHRILPAAGGPGYREPTLVLFTDAVDSGCGFGRAAMGPFYCPLDSKVYLDLGFFRELDERFGAPGDFARAYVVAHEVGHHVQNLLGLSDDVHRRRQSLSESEGNDLSVRLELQADCFAGVWAHQAEGERDLLEAGDLEEGLAAAAAIGDDRLQRETQGRVSPESWTHGSSEQRVRWFRTGFESGDPARCETFEAARI